MSVAHCIRIYGLNCSKEDVLKDLSHDKGTHIVEQIIMEFPSVVSNKNTSDKHLQEWHRADPTLVLLASVDPFQPYFPFSDHFSRCIITALHNRYQSDEGSIQNTARARFLLVSLHLYSGASNALFHTEKATKNEECVLLCLVPTFAHHHQPLSSHPFSLSQLSGWRHHPNSLSEGLDLGLHKIYFQVLGKNAIIICWTYEHQDTQKACATMVLRTFCYSIQPPRSAFSCFMNHMAARCLLKGISKAGLFRLAKNPHSPEHKPECPSAFGRSRSSMGMRSQLGGILSMKTKFCLSRAKTGLCNVPSHKYSTINFVSKALGLICS